MKAVHNIKFSKFLAPVFYLFFFLQFVTKTSDFGFKVRDMTIVKSGDLEFKVRDIT